MLERRTIEQASANVRIEKREDGTERIVGYAAVYYRAGTPGTEFKLWEGMVERIERGAFDAAIKRGDDARALFNHDPSLLLGRRSANTLTLSVDSTGLRYEIEPGKTSVAADVLEHIRRGDLQGSSFAFRVTDQEFRTENDLDIRVIKGVELYDVGPVTYPAYEATSTGLRSADELAEVQAAYEDWKRTQNIRFRIEQAGKRAKVVGVKVRMD